EEKKHCLASSVSSPRKGQTAYNTEYSSNYNFLPNSIGALTSASGRKVTFSGNQVFASFYDQFKDDLSYEAYLENIDEGEAIFTGKDKRKILGAAYKVGEGHLITLPILKYKEYDFTEMTMDVGGEEIESWNKKG